MSLKRSLNHRHLLAYSTTKQQRVARHAKHRILLDSSIYFSACKYVTTKFSRQAALSNSLSYTRWVKVSCVHWGRDSDTTDYYKDKRGWPISSRGSFSTPWNLTSHFSFKETQWIHLHWLIIPLLLELPTMIRRCVFLPYAGINHRDNRLPLPLHSWNKPDSAVTARMKYDGFRRK